jgi:hypothetical protein
MTDQPETTAYTMVLCGDCASGPPCRCSRDPAIVSRVWSNGRWVWLATCSDGKSE